MSNYNNNNNNNNNNNIHNSFFLEDPQAIMLNIFNPNSQNIGGFDNNPSNNYNYNSNYVNNNGNYDNNSNNIRFNEFLLHGSMDYTSPTRNLGLLSPTTSEVLSSVVDSGGGGGNEKMRPPVSGGCGGGGGSGGETSGPHTPKSSISLSSNEAGCGVDDESSHGKGDENDDEEMKQSNDQSGEDSKKANNNKGGKKKGEKKEKEARYAFLTKTEDDHLEDGYRWRKYGQKAVKNSPFPRSYYRCTTQKCTVKKRVERSFQDPTTVITTYEGQHNHPVPATLRGHAAVAALLPHHYSMLTQPPPPPPPSSTTTFTQQLLSHFGHDQNYSHFSQLQQFHNNNINNNSNIINNINNNNNNQRQLSIHDYGLLQDMIPSFLLKKEP